MSKTYILNDTARVLGSIHDDGGTLEDAMDLVAAGSATETSQALSGGGSAQGWVWATDVSEPGSADWGTQDIAGQLDVNAAGAGLSYGFRTAGAATGHIARLASNGITHQEDFQQTESLFTGTGFKGFSTGSQTWTAGAAGDRCAISLAITRAASHGNQDMTLNLGTASAYLTGPGWAAAQDTNSVLFGSNF